MTETALSGTSVLRIAQLNVTYLVPNGHPALAAVRSRLDSIAKRELTTTWAQALAPFCPDADSSVWFVQRLNVDVAVDAGWEEPRASAAWATQLTRSLARQLSRADDSAEVLRFANQAAYLAQFLRDLADGVAWSKWYYTRFHGLRALASNAALRQALCGEPLSADAALQQLSEEGGFDQVLDALKDSDCRAVLKALCGNEPDRDDADMTAAHLNAAMEVWQQGPSVDASLDRGAMRLYVGMRRGPSAPAPSPGLRRSIDAVLALARWMSAPTADRLLTALQQGDTATAFALVGAPHLERLAALLHCDRGVVARIAQQLRSRDQESVISRTVEKGQQLFTPFGGVFHLLPRLAELDLEDCASTLPNFENESPLPLLRFLVLLKCLGTARAPHAFFDPVLRELAGLAQGFGVDAVRAWARQVTPEATRNFQTRWATSCERVRFINSRWLCVRTARRGRLLLLANGERDFWLRALRAADELSGAVQAIHDSRSEHHECSPALLCEPALVSTLPATAAGIPVLAWNCPEALEHAAGDSPLAMCLAHARSPDADLNYLGLVSLLRGSRHLDITLSLLASTVLRDFAWRLPGFAWSSFDYIYANFLNVSATIQPQAGGSVARLSKPSLHIVLTMTGATQDAYLLPWLAGQRIRLSTSES